MLSNDTVLWNKACFPLDFLGRTNIDAHTVVNCYPLTFKPVISSIRGTVMKVNQEHVMLRTREKESDKLGNVNECISK